MVDFKSFSGTVSPCYEERQESPFLWKKFLRGPLVWEQGCEFPEGSFEVARFLYKELNDATVLYS